MQKQQLEEAIKAQRKKEAVQSHWFHNMMITSPEETSDTLPTQIPQNVTLFDKTNLVTDFINRPSECKNTKHKKLMSVGTTVGIST